MKKQLKRIFVIKSHEFHFIYENNETFKSSSTQLLSLLVKNLPLGMLLESYQINQEIEVTPVSI